MLGEFSNEISKEINNYSNYEKGWDGYDGDVFPKETINKAKTILSFIIAYFNKFNLIPDEFFSGPYNCGIMFELKYLNKELIFSVENGQLIDTQGNNNEKNIGENWIVFNSLYEGLMWLNNV